jgi:hypothetical protein
VETATTSQCLNCGAGPVSTYCAECGQKAGQLNPTLGELLHELWHEVLHIDGKVLVTARVLLTRPGLLTREYFAGRRAQYVRPLRLYLIFSVIYFGAIQLLPAGSARNSGFNVEFRPSANETAADVQAALEARGFRSQDEAKAATNEALTHYIPQAFFILVPFFALLVWLVTRQSGLNYPQHLYFALHVHAAAFAISAISQLAWLVPHAATADVLRMLGVLWMVIYVVVALKRVYRTTVVGALWRTAVIGPVYTIVIFATALAIGLGWLALRSPGASSG